MFSAIRLINALTGSERCEECAGCKGVRCGTCCQCEVGSVCLATICLDGLDRQQKKALRLKHKVYQEDEAKRIRTNNRLLQQVYLRAHRDA